VRLTTTAVAPWGTPANPRMFKASGAPETMGLFEHWFAGLDGLGALVSQIRMGAASALNREPDPFAEGFVLYIE